MQFPPRRPGSAAGSSAPQPSRPSPHLTFSCGPRSGCAPQRGRLLAPAGRSPRDGHHLGPVTRLARLDARAVVARDRSHPDAGWQHALLPARWRQGRHAGGSARSPRRTNRLWRVRRNCPSSARDEGGVVGHGRGGSGVVETVRAPRMECTLVRSSEPRRTPIPGDRRRCEE